MKINKFIQETVKKLVCEQILKRKIQYKKVKKSEVGHQLNKNVSKNVTRGIGFRMINNNM